MGRADGWSCRSTNIACRTSAWMDSGGVSRDPDARASDRCDRSRARCRVVAEPLVARPDLPERILLHDLAVAECPEVAAADFDPLAPRRRPGQGPLRDTPLAVDEVVVVGVADVRDAGEAA